MPSEHVCDKAMTVDSHGRQIGELYDGRRESDRRITEMETTLFGAERNGGGFIKETREAFVDLRAGQTELKESIDELGVKVGKLTGRKRVARDVLVAAMPAIGSIVALVLTWFLTRGSAP